MKIGIMGGTFNPVHFGHLFLAENAFEQAELDQVLFMPSKNPPHKPLPSMISEGKRVDMLKLAIADNSHFELSILELNREGLTYTADTLLLLKEQNPKNEYYFIVGTDSLFYMDQWKDPQIIFDHSIILVAGRDHANLEEIHSTIDFLSQKYGARIQYIKMPMLELSSADIRERIRNHQSIRYHMPDTVIGYIEQHGLYHGALEG